jgi:hypothetical protein
LSWFYQDKQLDQEDIPPKAIGFIYLITQLSTGKRYIGRKLLTKAGRKTINGKTKKIRVESDWQGYWSSSPDLRQLVKDIGEHDFRREVLQFVSSKGSLAYCEEMALYQMGALESDSFMNGNIRSKVYRSWVKPDEAQALRSTLSKLTQSL